MLYKVVRYSEDVYSCRNHITSLNHMKEFVSVKEKNMGDHVVGSNGDSLSFLRLYVAGKVRRKGYLQMDILERQILIVDGGFATQSKCHMDEQLDGTPLWVSSLLASNPDAVVKTHLDFLRAGSNVLMTNTYQASIGGFVKHLGLSEEQSIELIKSATRLVKQAHSIYLTEENCDEDAEGILIAGAAGPYGASLNDCSEYTGSYMGHVSAQELADWHRPKLQALVDSGVDLFAFETIPAQKEAEVLLELLREFPEQKAWLSFSCKDEIHISNGDVFQDSVLKCWEMNPSQLIGVGVNCVDPDFVTSLLRGINANRPNDPVPLLVYPNKGGTYDPEKGWVGPQKCRPLETYVPEWLDLGVMITGGCCQTSAVDARNIKSAAKKWVLEKKKV